MRLYHFSDDPGIERFEPRPVRVASLRQPGKEWLNGPLVWAIDEAHEFMYLFPRDCPRILIWAKPDTIADDRRSWLGDWRAVAYVERVWLDRLSGETICRYEMPVEGFEDLDDAGMWVARRPVVPIGVATLSGLDREFAPRGVELRVVDSLKPLKPLWQSSLHVSGIRLRNALDWV
ncbi:DUF6886 family protein [Rhizobium sp. YS-1r]|uniref:DUF6886 family protein n=1 Tax=Rhizobium sp. YS-1r TaxID=1532558 RepID=UPI00050EA2CE|nr:DUF6886 family protein [Rhizobium sp. YS-1r]KGE00790.1 hypothetical protein JL39_06475 [Rhizobium sp. YS-1r]